MSVTAKHGHLRNMPGFVQQIDSEKRIHFYINDKLQKKYLFT